MDALGKPHFIYCKYGEEEDYVKRDEEREANRKTQDEREEMRAKIREHISDGVTLHWLNKAELESFLVDFDKNPESDRHTGLIRGELLEENRYVWEEEYEIAKKIYGVYGEDYDMSVRDKLRQAIFKEKKNIKFAEKIIKFAEDCKRILNVLLFMGGIFFLLHLIS